MHRFSYIFGLNLLAAVAVGGVVFYVLFNTALTQTGYHLMSQVENRRALISAIIEFARDHNIQHDGGVGVAVLEQLRSAQILSDSFGQTGEFVVGKSVDEEIQYLLRQRRFGIVPPNQKPDEYGWARPMQLALRGQTGIIEARDYSGVAVIAAYLPVPELGLGLVAKIDVEEVKSPYYTAAAIGVLLSLVIFGFVSVIFLRLAKPINRRINESERLFRHLISGSPSFEVYARHDGEITYISEAYCLFLGVQKTDVIGQNFLDFYASENQESLAEQLSGLSESGASFQHIQYQTSADGNEHCIEWTLSLLYDRRNRPDKLICIGQDVTRIKAEENARKELQKIIELSPVIVFLWKNTDGWPVEFVSKNIADFGYDTDAFLSGKIKYIDLIHADDVDRVSGEAALHSSQRSESFTQEYRLQSANGIYKTVSDHTWIRQNSKGEITHFQGVIQDVTEKKKIQASFEWRAKIRKTILQCQNSLIKTTKEGALWPAIFGPLIEEQDYPLVWVGRISGDNPVKRLASAGRAEAYLDDLPADGSGDQRENNLSERAQGSTSLKIATIKSDHSEQSSSWKKAATFGLRSCAEVPILIENVPAFLLYVYKEAEDGFDAAEVELLTQLARDLGNAIQAIRSREENTKIREQLAEATLGAISAIAATIEKRDPYTAGHQNRVSDLSVAIARELAWSDFRIEGLRLGAMVHDIGKIYVPAEILNRPGKLTDAEFEIIKSHPTVGADIISHAHFPWPIREMILQHHERIDGTGYPKGLTGSEIIDEAKILAIADTAEAITAHRPYRPALGLEASLKELERGKGTVFDPKIVDVCIDLISRHKFVWTSE